jgi:hypothetical protein
MNEIKFISSIDCRFPYSNPKKARALAGQSLKISPNAVFTVMHELARLPKIKRSSQSERLAVLEFIEERFAHPLSGITANLARRMIAKKKISVQQAIRLIKVVGNFPGCYGALSLVYFANDSASPLVDQAFDVVKKNWEQKSDKFAPSA